MHSQTLKLLLNICNCPNIKKAADNELHPCHRIVNVQNSRRLSDFQLPEPWNGDVVNVPLLVLSSNPSISEAEAYPTTEWKREKIVDFFSNRFSENRTWTNGWRPLCSDGKYLRSVSFWASIHKQAERIFGREVKAGKDYALTEVVHCKSRGEENVSAALEQCAGRWTTQIIGISKARVIMVVGKIAERWFCKKYGISPQDRLLRSCDVEGRNRAVLIVPHPNSRGKRRVDKILKKEQVEWLNGTLQASSR